MPSTKEYLKIFPFGKMFLSPSNLEMHPTGIPAVVAMQFKVTDSAAIQLAESFYRAVALGKPVDHALTTARRMVEADEEYNFEWGTPVLFMRSPDGYLFDPQEFKYSLKDIPECPYKGLAAFQKEDKDNFFGRQKFTKELLAVVEEKSLVALLGNSGSGKSSVVFAGLVPEIEEKDWLVTSFKPRKDPFYQVAASVVHSLEDGLTELDALKQIEKCAKDLKNGELSLFRIIERIIAKHNKPVLLIVDQFEELFTLSPDKNLQGAFLKQLLEASQKDLKQFRLLLTMRSDFMSHALDHVEFGQALSQATVMLTAMSREELREVIEKPAEKKRVDLEAGLTGTILDDVLTTANQKDIAGRLPLLEFALTLLWDEQEKLTLTHDAYKTIGKVEGSLALHAEGIYRKFPKEEQERLKHIFTQLVRPGEGTEDTRQVGTKKQIGEQNWSLVSQLASKRLVTTDQAKSKEETVEVIHEALIRRWKRLRDWVDADRDFRLWQNRLRPRIDEWQEKNKDEDMLLRGRELLQAKECLDNRQEQIEEIAKEFIKASGDKREAEIEEELRKREEKERLLAEQKRLLEKEKRQQKNIILIVSLAALIAFVLAGAALLFGKNAVKAQKETERQKEVVEQERDRKKNAEAKARENSILALSRYLGTKAILAAKDPNLADGLVDFAALLAVQSVKVKKDSESVGRALRTLQAVPHLDAILQGHNDRVLSLAFSFDGKMVVSSSGDQTVRLWDVLTGKPIGEPWQGHSSSVLSVAFSPDGKMVVSGSHDRTLRLWNTITGKPIGEPWQGHSSSVLSVAFSPDGKMVVSGDDDHTVRLWDVLIGKPIGELWQGHSSSVLSVVFSPDGKIVASGSDDQTVRLWDVLTGEPIGKPWQGHSNTIRSVDFSPDGRMVVSSSDDHTVRLWDVLTGEPIGKPWQGHSKSVFSVAFSPDGKMVVSGSGDQSVRLWDVLAGKPIGEPWQGHSESVFSVAFSPDGKMVVSGSNDRTVRLWDVQIGEPISEPQQGHSASVFSVAFSPDGKMVVSGSNDQSVQLWDALTGKPIGEPWQGHSDWIKSVTFSPDGKMVVSGSNDQSVRLWDALTGKPIGEPWQGHSDRVLSVAFSPDGKMVVSGSDDQTLRLWDVLTGKPIGEPWLGHSASVVSVAFSPDSKMVASGSHDRTVRLWNVLTGELIGEPWQGHSFSRGNALKSLKKPSKKL